MYYLYVMNGQLLKVRGNYSLKGGKLLRSLPWEWEVVEKILILPRSCAS
jgi:hypothetical protein